MALLTYVDDVTTTGTCIDDIDKIKLALHSQFTIKDLGPLKYFLRLEIARSDHGTMISKTKFINDILFDTGMLQCKPASCPLPKGLHLSSETSAHMIDPDRLKRLIGKLLYVNLTRPDISHVVQYLSQFMSALRQTHWEAAMHVLRYLKAIAKNGLYFSIHSSLQLTPYCDSDWPPCCFSQKSLTGYGIFLGPCLLS